MAEDVHRAAEMKESLGETVRMSRILLHIVRRFIKWGFLIGECMKKSKYK